MVGRDDSVGIATHYGLESPEIESLWVVRFSLPVQTGPEVEPVSYTSVSQPPGPGINYTGPREVSPGICHFSFLRIFRE